MLAARLYGRNIVSFLHIKSSITRRFVGSLVIGDFENGELTKNTLCAIEIAKRFGNVSLWLCSSSVEEKVCTGISKSVPVSTIYFSTISNPSALLPENKCYTLKQLHAKNKYDMICGCSTSTSKAMLSRFAATLNVPLITDITNMIDTSSFQRYAYAGNVLETVNVSSSPKIMTIRPSSHIKPVESSALQSSSIISVDITINPKFASIQSENTVRSNRPDLSTCTRVVVGGRGVGDSKKFQIVHDLADKINAAVGATRAAVDMGMVESNAQVGQTGKIISPALYIGLGVSGSIQHQAGMKEAQTIVCINSDAEAPLFSISDFGIVGDLHVIVPELIAKL